MSTNQNPKINIRTDENVDDDGAVRLNTPLSARPVRSSSGSRAGPKSSKIRSAVSETDLMNVSVETVKRKADKSPSISPRDAKSDSSGTKAKTTKKRLVLRSRNVSRRSDEETDDSEVEIVPPSPDSLMEQPTRSSRRSMGISPPRENPRNALERCPSPSRFDNYNPVALGKIVEDLMSFVDDKRYRSKNIQGGISGEMKSGIDKAKSVVRVLVERLEDKGDWTFLKQDNIRLRYQLSDIKKLDVEKTEEIKFLKESMATMTREMESIKKALYKRKDTYLISESDSSAMEVQPELQTMLTPFPAPLPQRVPSAMMKTGNPAEASSGGLHGNDKPGKKRKKEIRTNIKNNVNIIEKDELSYSTERLYLEIEMWNRNRPEKERIKNPFKSNLEPCSPSPPPRIERRGRPRKDRGITNLVLSGAAHSDEVSTPKTVTSADPHEWRTVVKRRRSKRTAQPNQSERVLDGDGPISYSAAVARNDPVRGPGLPRRSGPSHALKNRNLRTAAITITGVAETFSYADAIQRAKKRIPLDKLGIESSKIRRTINGGRIIEIPGVDAAKKADALAVKLREVLGSDFAVNRPIIRGELRIVGIGDSTTPEEIIAAVADLGGCASHEIKVGAIRSLNNGLGAIWLQCPLTAAIRVSAKNKIRIGWTVARVNLLDKRPVQCFKCWHYGHVRYNCTSEVNYQ